MYIGAIYNKYNLYGHGRMFLKMELYLLYTAATYNLYREAHSLSEWRPLLSPTVYSSFCN